MTSDTPGEEKPQGGGQGLADLLYLAVNCLASLFSYVSQFPHSTCQEIFLAFY